MNKYAYTCLKSEVLFKMRPYAQLDMSKMLNLPYISILRCLLPKYGLKPSYFWGKRALIPFLLKIFFENRKKH